MNVPSLIQDQSDSDSESDEDIFGPATGPLAPSGGPPAQTAVSTEPELTPMEVANEIIERLVEADRDYQLWMARFRQAREELALIEVGEPPDMTSIHGGMRSESESEESEGDDDGELMDMETESDEAEAADDEEEAADDVEEEEDDPWGALDAQRVQAEIEEWQEIEQRHRQALNRMGEEFVGGDIALLEDHWSVQMAAGEREAYLRANQAVNAWEAASVRRQHKDEMVKERERTKWAKDLREM